MSVTPDLVKLYAGLVQPCILGFFIAFGLISLCLLVTLHELGHFLFCKLFNIATPSFSIGFGPRIISKKIGDTVFAISLIPFGGYVEIAGSAEVGQGEQKLAHARDERSFATKPYWQKFLVMIGGILFNLIFAYLVFIGIFLVGIKRPSLSISTAVVSNVTPGNSNLQVGDRIVALDDVPVENKGDVLFTKIVGSPGQTVTFHVLRDGVPLAVPVAIQTRTIKGSDQLIGSLEGIAMLAGEPIEPQSLPKAISRGIGLAHQLMKKTVEFVVAKIKREPSVAQQGLMGPVGIVTAIVTSLRESSTTYFLVLALISIGLAMINLLPLPILDGGQILFCTIESITGRPVPMRIRYVVDIISIGFVVLLLAYATFFDLGSLATRIRTALGK